MTMIKPAAVQLVEVSALPDLPPGVPGVDVFVPGEPQQQGSKNKGINRRTGRIQMWDANQDLKPWRTAATTILRSETRHVRSMLPFDKGGVTLGLEFVRARIKSLPKTKTPDCSGKPDWDKYARAAGDSITDAGLWKDDGQVTTAHVIKRWAEPGEEEGVRIMIVPARNAFRIEWDPAVMEQLRTAA